MVTAYIALGSNLGNRRATLDEAIARLRLQPGIDVIRVSSYHETDPVGGPPGQEKYLNAAAELQTTLSARKLLAVLLAIETQLGRVRAERFGPRTIDLDLLLYGTDIVQVHEPGCDLTVPHPRMHERAFVLAPLVEIAALAVHPVRQSTVKDLLDRLAHSVESKRELAGLNAIVTGSTSGIGRAIALALADGGANVVIHGRRSLDAAERVAEVCRQKKVKAATTLADLRNDTEHVKLIDAAGRLGPIDIWINNAGADTLTGDAAKWPFERKLEELWAVDVRASMLLSRAVGGIMKRQGRGVILTMGWDQADTGMDGDSGQLFGAVKGAVMAFTKSLAIELAPEVRVNCLAPGWIRTAWGEHASNAWQTRVLQETPLGRWGTPEDVAQVARWLVSPAAAFITGQIIRINGGAVRG
ncbi:MAG: 2-amino-4-hydroxy-6-hydroxymethyldihydropteridine diphosphokinase [Planctomycetes bacterium]|nr:2-amino-4-hydroxy-6-hydroxymethyldihydropteridine diphosphokinase [Planctomycetota bacterium]